MKTFARDRKTDRDRQTERQTGKERAGYDPAASAPRQK